MEKLVILDFNSGNVLILPYNEQNLDDYLEYLEEIGEVEKVKDCQWMVTNKSIIIK